ncbi:hypothetical protein L0F63_004685, partial [Massospora cicadina]
PSTLSHLKLSLHLPPPAYKLPPNLNLTKMALPEEVTTLFIVGFPDDFTEREFNNMFLFAAGFEAAMLKPPELNLDSCSTLPSDKQLPLMGFVKFRSRQEAIAAQKLLNGKLVDQERMSVLKVEIAKKNLHIKRPIRCYSDTDRAAAPEPKERDADSDLEKSWEMFVDDLVSTETSTEEADYSWLTSSKAPTDFMNAFLYRAKKSFDEMLKLPTDSNYDQGHFFSPFTAMPTNNTLFSEKMQLASHLTYLNLSSPVKSTFPSTFRPLSATSFSDRRSTPQPPPPEELRQVFSSCPGYKRLCMRYKAGANPKAGPMCFVEFDSKDDAADAMNEKNGLLLSNSEKGGIRLSFSKNPLGVRRQPPPISIDVASSNQPLFRPPLTAAPAPGLSFYGFSNPVTPVASQFKSLDRPL